MIFTIKYIGNDFYYKNMLEMIFTIKIHWTMIFIIKIILLWKSTGNDFYYIKEIRHLHIDFGSHPVNDIWGEFGKYKHN